MVSQERTEGIMNNLRKISEFRGSNRVMEDHDVPENSCFNNENCRNSTASAERESLFMKQAMTNEIAKTVVIESTIGNDKVTVTDEQPSVCELPKADNSSFNIKATIATENPAEVSGDSDEEPDRTCGTKNQRQLTVSKTSIPDWTDEQLNQLFAFDD